MLIVYAICGAGPLSVDERLRRANARLEAEERLEAQEREESAPSAHVPGPIGRERAHGAVR